LLPCSPLPCPPSRARPFPIGSFFRLSSPRFCSSLSLLPALVQHLECPQFQLPCPLVGRRRPRAPDSHPLKHLLHLLVFHRPHHGRADLEGQVSLLGPTRPAGSRPAGPAREGQVTGAAVGVAAALIAPCAQAWSRSPSSRWRSSLSAPWPRSGSTGPWLGPEAEGWCLRVNVLPLSPNRLVPSPRRRRSAGRPVIRPGRWTLASRFGRVRPHPLRPGMNPTRPDGGPVAQAPPGHCLELTSRGPVLAVLFFCRPPFRRRETRCLKFLPPIGR